MHNLHATLKYIEAPVSFIESHMIKRRSLKTICHYFLHNVHSLEKIKSASVHLSYLFPCIDIMFHFILNLSISFYEDLF